MAAESSSIDFLSVVVSLFTLCFALILIVRKKISNKVCLVVLGDVGRSPRMQYHALSLADEGFDIDLVGFEGSPPLNKVLMDRNITVSYIAQPPTKLKGMPPLLYYIFKTVVQAFQLLFHLTFQLSKPSYFLIQNPPSIPSLAVTWLVSRIKGSCLIIDWHNYGYTILSLNLRNKDHPLVRCSYWYEGFFGSLADKNICVTKAMQEDLLQRWRINASVMYDRPAAAFKPVTVEEKHELFTRLRDEYPEFAAECPSNFETKFTYTTKDGRVGQNRNRPALLISSTSWTDDEDFSLLLDAFSIYEQKRKADLCMYPDIVCAITGKGPLKEYYIQQIKRKDFKHVTVLTPWLTPEDYPKLVGSSDLGICLHFSSSGLDLPMKVVDMFGCQLPVCAISYPCLHELVSHGENGLLFKTAKDLAEDLMDLLIGFPERQEKLTAFRDNLVFFQDYRWQRSWNKSVRPLFQLI